MNIVYIIGNGFDLNLGLKTSYQDFYRYFVKTSSNKLLLKEMKENMDSETWADLEIALGKYTSKFNSTEEFQEVYYEISDELAKYIRLEEGKLNSSDEIKDKLSKDIICPESYFPNTSKNNIAKYSSVWSNTNWNVNIINFNYSQTIEKLLDFQTGQKLLLGKNRYNNNVYLSKIVHLHGVADVDETILLGVNDTSQIENESFRTDNDILDIIVKRV